ncbi:MAG: ribosome recycling factor, partial [Pyramidobacter sp.]|nr:ribosome recycling factor [Pyramidobacter sp.]
MSSFDLDAKMQKVLEHLDGEYQGIRTGRAHPGLLESVKVDYYGSAMPVKQLATVTVPEPRMLMIAPFDKGATKMIEKAILAANIGLTPNVDGNNIRLVVPELTGERRKEFVKMAAKIAEEAKVALRNIRRDANDFFKKQEKASEITEDDLKLEL